MSSLPRRPRNRVSVSSPCGFAVTRVRARDAPHRPEPRHASSPQLPCSNPPSNFPYDSGVPLPSGRARVRRGERGDGDGRRRIRSRGEPSASSRTTALRRRASRAFRLEPTITSGDDARGLWCGSPPSPPLWWLPALGDVHRRNLVTAKLEDADPVVPGALLVADRDLHDPEVVLSSNLSERRILPSSNCVIGGSPIQRGA
jgi:hypothetical protein